MKIKEIFHYAAFCLTLLLLMVPEICTGQEDWEVLKYRFWVDTTPRHQWTANIEYNSIDNEFMAIYHTEGILRDDCDPGDDYECTHQYHSMDGRRVSTDGEVLGEIELFSPTEDGMNGADLAHNMFTNEYLFASPILNAAYEIYINRTDSAGKTLSGPELLIEGGGATVMLPAVCFNHVRRNYLVAYNDKNVFNAYLNNVGFIVDEDGTPIKGPFPIGNQLGDFYAMRIAFNPTNETYLVAWEDFRHVENDWAAPCDIYGALLDAEGGMIAEIPIADDTGMEDEGDARVPVPVYNPDKNEFLVFYKDIKDSLDNAAILGRFVNADGTLAGDAFVIEDHPRIQHWPDIIYVEEEKKYFMIWNELRNDGLDADDPFYISDDIDVYASWLDSSGNLVGDEIIIADSINWQFTPRMAYSPVMKKFLIVWNDRDPVDDYEYEGMTGVPFAAAPMDIMGTIYGIPSLLSGQVVDEETGSPVEDARVLVIGPSLPALRQTSIGGWFNIEKNSQVKGLYLVAAFKRGYLPAIKAVVYTGEPLQVTMKAKRYSRQTTSTTSITATTTTIPGDQTTTTTADITTTTTIMCTASEINLTMVDIPGGTFEMGCSPGDVDCLTSEKPSHTVTISAFKMSAYEITQDQWKAIMCDDPSYFQGCPNCPVEEVSWLQIQIFIERLNELTGESYRLPTEAEWECAARAGITTKYYCGDDASCLDGIAWYAENSDDKPQLVGQKEPNAWGLYDMLGNVAEYCQDFYDDGYYEESPDTDPQGPEAGFYRVMRGGGWQDDAEFCRVSYRSYNFPDTSYSVGGFRLVQD